MAVSLIMIDGLLFPIQDRPRRIQGAAERLSKHTIIESGRVAIDSIVGSGRFDFLNERFGQKVIGIERQHPGRGDIFEAEIALAGEGIEFALDHLGLGKARYQLQCLISAEAIDDEHLFGPKQLVQRARDVGRFVEGQDERGDVGEHGASVLRCFGVSVEELEGEDGASVAQFSKTKIRKH